MIYRLTLATIITIYLIYYVIDTNNNCDGHYERYDHYV